MVAEMLALIAKQLREESRRQFTREFRSHPDGSEHQARSVNASTRASALTPATGSLLSVSYAFAYQPLLPSRIGKEHRIFSPSSNRPYAGSYGVIRNKVGLLI